MGEFIFLLFYFTHRVAILLDVLAGCIQDKGLSSEYQQQR